MSEVDTDDQSASQLRQRMRGYFEAQVETICAWQNDDGSFGPQRQLNDQYAFAPLALLYSLPDSRYHQSPELLAVIQRGMDHLLNSLDEQGRIEFFGHDGISHGWVYYEWVTFYWQETLELLCETTDPSWQERHKDALELVLDGHFQKLKQGWDHHDRAFKKDSDVANLFVWNALLMYRSGELWQRPEWRELGETVMHAAIAAQQPEGWWYESGPVNIYSMVTAQAVSVYYELSGDSNALEAVKRALEYHTAFSYPDGTAIETVDGRMPYHQNVAMMLPPTFSRFKEGVRYLNRIVDHLPDSLERLQGISMMTSTLGYLSDTPEESTIESRQFDAPCQVLPGLPAAVIRPHDFCISACGYQTVAHPSNWRLDRQNLISIWHKKTGLIVGGGNSKLQPAFSCFNVNDRSGQIFYLHHQPKIQADDNSINLTMRYGPVPVSIAIKVTAPDRVRLTFACASWGSETDAPWHVEAHLILRGKVGERLQGEHNQPILDDQAIWWTAEEQGNRLKHHGWALGLPESEQLNVQWPVRPFNPYRPDRKSTLEQSALIVNVPLWADAPQAIFDIKIGDEAQV